MVHLPFTDRRAAGQLLANELGRHNISGASVVLALPRGGVPVGFVVAEQLHLPLDVVVVRKLGVPWQPELAMGAIAASAQVRDSRVIRQLAISDAEVEEVVAREQAELRRREDLYRGGAPPSPLNGRTVILIDDGLATGSTMLVAVRHVRAMNPARVIVGVPVGSVEACERLRRESDSVICLATPDPFGAVGAWYRDFAQVGDTEVQDLLTQSRERMRLHPKSLSAA
jgi:predicted phosphoribosyltransferase